MILSNTEIRRRAKEGSISVRPYFDPNHLRTFGLRVHLANEILVPKPNQQVDLARRSAMQVEFEKVNIEQSQLVLKPGDFVLASTIESFKLDSGLLLRLDGRSTLARLGLTIHCTAEVIDGTHKQHRSIVLELANVGPLELSLPYRCAIGQVVFETVSGNVDLDFEQHQYEGQISVLPPNLAFATPEWLDYEPSSKIYSIARFRRGLKSIFSFAGKIRAGAKSS